MKTRLFCPLPDCTWSMIDDREEKLSGAVAENMAQAMGVPAGAFTSIEEHRHLQAIEATLHQHFTADHQLYEWVQAVTDLRRQKDGWVSHREEITDGAQGSEGAGHRLAGEARRTGDQA